MTGASMGEICREQGNRETEPRFRSVQDSDAGAFPGVRESDGKNGFCSSCLREVRKTEQIAAMSVAVERGGKILYSFTDSDGSLENFSADTPLAVMSITKIFTSALLIALMEEGRLSLYDNVRRFIPEFPFDDVLILHLMTHTSGLSGYLNSPDGGKIFSRLTREFPLDTNFKYYSSGYDILTEALERITGTDIRDYAKQRIFDPLRMNSSALESHTGKAGMMSTAGDLIRFSRHILEIRRTGVAGILKPCSVELMFREHTRGRYDRTPAFFRKSQTRRFGRYFGDLNSEEAVGHAGASGCFLLLDPKYDAILVILTNGSRTIQLSDENFARINNLLMGSFL